MPTFRQSTESIKDQIREAFANVPYPGDDDLVGHKCEECKEVEARFKGQAWQELSSDTIDSYYFALSLFTPPAFRYYLPAFMIFTLENLDSGSSAVDTTVFSLCPLDSDNDSFQFIRVRCDAITTRQKDVVRVFLRVVEGHGYQRDVASAFSSYWGV